MDAVYEFIEDGDDCPAQIFPILVLFLDKLSNQDSLKVVEDEVHFVLAQLVHSHQVTLQDLQVVLAELQLFYQIWQVYAHDLSLVLIQQFGVLLRQIIRRAISDGIL